jgi:hypothetical protein
MNPSKFETYFIPIFGIVFTVAMLILGYRSHEEHNDYWFIGCFMLTGLCAFAIGAVRDWAEHRNSKSILWFLVPPATVLAYEAWFVVKFIFRGTFAAIREVRDWPFLITVVISCYLWMQRSKLRDQRERYKSQLEYAQEALARKHSRCPRCGKEL